MFLKKKPNEYLQELKDMIENERVNQDLKQTELAKKAGVNFSTYTKFISINNISLDRLVKLLIALNLTDKLDMLIKKTEFTSLEQLRKIDEDKSKTKKRVR
jgi:transcriptional regulator with XRE-family HTH domain